MLSGSDMSTLVEGVGDGGGVWSVGASPCDLLRRFDGCVSGDSDRGGDRDEAAEDGEADEDVDGRPDILDAAAARSAWVTGTCMPRLGRDSDLRRVLYGMMYSRRCTTTAARTTATRGQLDRSLQDDNIHRKR